MSRNKIEEIQVQVEYGPGKIIMFNVPDKPCTYEELKCDIQARIHCLKDKVFGMQYLDDDGNWIITISNTCIAEAFRCAVPVAGSSMRRIKMRTFDGCSPQPVSSQSQVATKTLKPKSLFVEENMIHLISLSM